MLSNDQSLKEDENSGFVLAHIISGKIRRLRVAVHVRDERLLEWIFGQFFCPLRQIHTWRRLDPRRDNCLECVSERNQDVEL